MIKIQSLKSKKGEVDFRKKLSEQLEGKNHLVPSHPTKKKHLELIKQRIKDTKQIFSDLKKRDILLSPYLEVGAEFGHRSMLLENELQVEGFASDISQESLKGGNKILKFLHFNKLPIMICCDAYNLPFSSNSLPFVFCFQTLHHFPNPKPILKEINRILTPGGYFFFSEEPVSQFVNFNFWRRDFHLTWYEKILKKLVILHFISKIGKTEVEHNILEEDFDLQTWEDSLNVFHQVDVTLKAFPYGPTTNLTKSSLSGWINPPLPQNLILQLLGGGITALCQKKGKPKKTTKKNIMDLLSCPNCNHKPKLVYNKTNRTLKCLNCKTTFKLKRGIYTLLSEKTNKSLYGNNL